MSSLSPHANLRKTLIFYFNRKKARTPFNCSWHLQITCIHIYIHVWCLIFFFILRFFFNSFVPPLIAHNFLFLPIVDHSTHPCWHNHLQICTIQFAKHSLFCLLLSFKLFLLFLSLASTAWQIIKRENGPTSLH